MQPVSLEPVITRLRDALGQESRAMDTEQVIDILRGLHPADIALLLDTLTLPEALAVFGCVDTTRAAEVLDEVSPETKRYLVEESPRERIVTLLDILPMDDAADVVADVGTEEAQQFLAELPATDTAEVRTLLAFPEATVGRLMTDKFVAVRPNITAAQALTVLRRSAEYAETINVAYVLDSGGRLAGVFAVRDLLLAKPDDPVQSFMTPEPLAVPPDLDQQEGARLIAQYDLLAIPVVDEERRVLGIVTVDDMIDVLVEEFEEDVALMVGTDAEEMERRSPVEVAKLRLPWIMTTMFIELFAGLVIHRYDHVLAKYLLLASFMPVISAISGNTGLQSAAIVIRGLSTGHIQIGNWRHAVIRQLATTLILGGVCALTLGIIGGLWDGHWSFGLTVFLGMFLAINIAGVVGTVVPMISKRLGYDPALTAGPFETAFQDVVGITIFLTLASVLLTWLR